jgi:hypothetical protein
LAAAQGKVVSGRGYFDTGRVTEVTKFSFRPGTSHVTGELSWFGPARGSLYMFMDTNWATSYHGEADCDKVKHAHTRIPIGRPGRQGHGIGVQLGHNVVADEASGKSSWKFEWEISHAMRTYGWYFVIADCRGFQNGDDSEAPDGEPDASRGEVSTSAKAKARRRLKRNQFDYSLELLNPDGDHLPADEYGLTTLYWLATGSMGAYFFSSTREYKRRTGNGILFDSHAVVKAFAFAYAFQIASMALEIVHLWFYAGNGRGVFVCDFFSEFFEGFSQLIISFALLSLGNGWTLVDFSRRAPGGSSPGVLKQLFNKPTLDDETPTLFLLIIIVFVSTVLQIVNKVQDDDFLKFHDHDGIAGKFLLVQRLLLGTAFFWSIRGTMGSDEVKGQLQLQGFLARLTAFGTAWFFAFPLLVLVASFFAHYLRHRLVTGGVLVLQSVCLTLMASQLFSDRSWYSKVSEVAGSGMLPGAFQGSKSGKSY